MILLPIGLLGSASSVRGEAISKIGGRYGAWTSDRIGGESGSFFSSRRWSESASNGTFSTCSRGSSAISILIKLSLISLE